jgi:hypothetical protein
MEHEFTKRIREILESHFGDMSDRVFSESEIIQYLNIKTKSASKGSKSRGSFANLYAVYVLVEDYLSRDFHKSGKYAEYEGAVFTSLFKRQRELPFGQKLQNHALNHRMNEEFKKYFRTCDYIPILRDPETNRYWFNDNLLRIEIDGRDYNLAEAIIEIVDAYVEAKKSAFQRFVRFCESSQSLKKTELIDFVMKPLGRFFQVTETVDVNKYFLDIDKIEKYPITFVIKSSDSIEALKNRIKSQAEKQYSIKAIVTRYMKCIEEIINVPVLLDRFTETVEQGHLDDILTEIVKQSKVEFSYDDDYDISEYQDIENWE